MQSSIQGGETRNIRQLNEFTSVSENGMIFAGRELSSTSSSIGPYLTIIDGRNDAIIG